MLITFMIQMHPIPLPYSSPLSLLNIIAYQEGSIVSRMVINKPAGTVTLFAFDKGEGLSEHSAPFDAMLIALEGQVEVTIEGESHLMSMGELIILPAQVPHAVKAISRFKMMLVMIHA